MPVSLWRNRAACRDAEPELFFNGGAKSNAKAREYCSECPVISQCLEFAIRARVRSGIWGGLHWYQIPAMPWDRPGDRIRKRAH